MGEAIAPSGDFFYDGGNNWTKMLNGILGIYSVPLSIQPENTLHS